MIKSTTLSDENLDSRSSSILFPKYYIEEHNSNGLDEMHVITGFRKKMYGKYYLFFHRHVSPNNKSKIKIILSSLYKSIKGFEEGLESGFYQNKGMYTEEDLDLRVSLGITHLDKYQGE